MRHWGVSFVTGVLFSVTLVAVAFFSPLFLPDTVFDSVLTQARGDDPAYFLQRNLPYGKDAVKTTLLIAAVAVLAVYIIVAASHLARPIGPGGAGSAWRRGIWWSGLITVLIVSATGAYVSLSIWLQHGEEETAMWWSLGVAGGAGVVFWFTTIIGSERMMRPAVPFGSRVTA